MTRQEKEIVRDVIIDLRKTMDLKTQIEVNKELVVSIDRLYDLINE